METTVLLVDSDLGFLFWLGRALDEAGYQAFPARSIPDALYLVLTLHLSVRVLILNRSLPGAESFVARLRAEREDLKVIALVENDDDREPATATPADAVCSKSADDRAAAQARWLATLSLLLGRRDDLSTGAN